MDNPPWPRQDGHDRRGTACHRQIRRNRKDRTAGCGKSRQRRLAANHAPLRDPCAPTRAGSAVRSGWRVLGLTCWGRACRALCTPAKECLRVRWMHPIAGGPMPRGDEIRDVQRATWAGLSAGWEKWDSVIMDQLGPVGTAIIERLDIADDQQHLDIAAGTGEPGLTVARLAPRGHVVLTDLAAEMLDIATRRANAHGITNFETKVCSADDLPFGDATFDSISEPYSKPHLIAKKKSPRAASYASR